MKSLTDDLVQRYRDTGYLAPIRVLTTAEAAEIRAKLETFETDAGPLAGKLRQKSHLLFTWLNDLIRHEHILDAVEDVIGPDRCRRGRHRSGHSVLGHVVLHQRAAQPCVCVLAPGFNLLGSRSSRYRH